MAVNAQLRVRNAHLWRVISVWALLILMDLSWTAMRAHGCHVEGLPSPSWLMREQMMRRWRGEPFLQ